MTDNSSTASTGSNRRTLPFPWPDPPLNIALIEPEIPPNTGNIARLCAATNSSLHLVGRLGFKLTDADLKRAGLDYWDSVHLTVHKNYATFLQALSPARFFYFSTKSSKSCFEARYEPGDVLVFGCETRGLSDDILEANRERLLGIPIQLDHVRSLNLSTAVGIVTYEALRQISTHRNSA